MREASPAALQQTRPLQFCCALIAALLLGACATVEKSGVPAGTARPSLDASDPMQDPFRVIEDAARRLAADEEALDTDETAGDLWARLTGRFSIARCPEGSSAARWAAWYAGKPDYMDRVFQRARPWLHHIANEIEARDLPGELALLPIVESAYDPFAYSRVRAAGSWQFLAATARDFGLEINDWYDGRRDVYAATGAALDYLAYLNGLFEGDWATALAAYNAGQGRVRRAINRNATRGRNTAWNDLPLPAETLGYVPKLKGLGCLFENPEAWGFELPRIEDKPRFKVVELPGPVDIVIAAGLIGLDVAELYTLNPGLNKHMTPPGGPHYLVVPLHRSEQLTAALAELSAADHLAWQEIQVRRGDSLSGLARRNNTSIRILREANGLNGDHLHVGQRLRLPVAGSIPDNPAYAAGYRELARLQERLLPVERIHHQVRPGESLWVIARRHGVSVADLRNWNGLGNSSLIRPGQQLVVESGRSAPAARSEDYVVRHGDSIWSIARRHRVAMNDLLRWNGLTADSILRPGQRISLRPGSDA